jgi:hypothetical protein
MLTWILSGIYLGEKIQQENRKKGLMGGGKGRQEKVMGSEYDQSTLYTCMKMS